MRLAPQAGVATLALICSISLATMTAVAQTGGSQTNTPSTGVAGPSIVTPQGQINTSADQTQAIFQSLESFATQLFPGFSPAPGKSVPQDMQLKPLPPQAKAAIPPQMKAAMPRIDDHHVAKIDDNTIVIVDPVTRQVVGVITNDDDGGMRMGIGPGPQQQPQSAPQPNSPGTK